MPAEALQPTFTDEGFEAFLQTRDEPAWLTKQRRDAWQIYRAQSWPDRRDEEWIRTDIRLFKLDHYALPMGAGGEATLPAAQLGEDVALAGFSGTLDSRPVEVRLEGKWAEKGVLFGSLDQLLAEHGDRIRPYLMRHAVNPAYDKFSALHAACWAGGHLLYVPRGVVVDEPFLALSALSDGGVDLGHTLVILEDGAEATMMSESASCSHDGSGFHCGAVEILSGPASNLRYINLQDWGHGVWHFAHQKAIVRRDASLQWTIGALGCRLCKVNQHVGLVEEGATCQVNGVLFTEGKQHLSYHTLQHHEAPNCRSDFLYKAALQDRSRTVWRGMIKVDPCAVRTDGYQRNDNLLLSDRARADSIPGLEIEADDVRCTHGSTSGKVDEELIFYAMCRGFTRREAIRVIVSGFFQQIFDRIPIQSVRDAFGRTIASRVREYD
ncbi:MAG: Fe-S cluster assembly protein SufD [Planctomycetes bacterium]|nr:Fe-S cluster assembly protein SufD [Planctomycetota bacterium]